MKIFKLIYVFNNIRRKWFTFLFTQKCKTKGSHLIVKGRFRLRNSGILNVGDDCLLDSSMETPIRIDIGSNAILEIGSQVYINEGTHIICNIKVNIGNRCLIAPEVIIMDDDGHPVDFRNRHNYWPKGPEDRIGAPIIIEENVWIGARSIILKGVTIGKGSVIAAGSVVTHSIPPYVLVAGVPAKIIRPL